MVSNSELVTTFVEAHNSHNIDAALSYLAERVRFETVGAKPRIGKKRMQELEEFNAVVESHVDLKDLRERKNYLIFFMRESNLWLRRIGIDELIYPNCRITVEDGLIEEIRTELDQKSIANLNEAYQAMVRWARKNHPKELASLMPEGEFVFSKAMAEGWMALLDQYPGPRSESAEM